MQSVAPKERKKSKTCEEDRKSDDQPETTPTVIHRVAWEYDE